MKHVEFLWNSIVTVCAVRKFSNNTSHVDNFDPPSVFNKLSLDWSCRGKTHSDPYIPTKTDKQSQRTQIRTTVKQLKSELPDQCKDYSGIFRINYT